jgi:hypothetical protein
MASQYSIAQTVSIVHSTFTVYSSSHAQMAMLVIPSNLLVWSVAAIAIGKLQQWPWPRINFNGVTKEHILSSVGHFVSPWLLLHLWPGWPRRLISKSINLFVLEVLWFLVCYLWLGSLVVHLVECCVVLFFAYSLGHDCTWRITLESCPLRTANLLPNQF